MENFVRVFVGLDVLRRHPRMKLHVSDKQKGFVRDTLAVLGIPPSILVDGRTPPIPPLHTRRW